MSFSRFRHTGNKSGSNPLPSPSTTPRMFLPPSHYAAAAGVEYRHNSTASTDTSSTSSVSFVSQGTPTQLPSDFSMSDSDTAPASTGLVSKLARKSSCKRSNSSSSSSRSDRSVPTSKQKRRESQAGELAMVETQLLPSLRDTIERMTHPTSHGSTTNTHSIPSDCLSPQSSTSSCVGGSTSRIQKFVASTSNPKPTPTSAPKSILKSALRTPTGHSITTTFSPPVKSLRSVKSMTSTSKSTTQKGNVVSPPIPWTPPSLSSRKTSSSSSSSRAYSSNPNSPNASLPKFKPSVPKAVSRIPTSFAAVRSPRFAFHELSDEIGGGLNLDGDRTPRRFPSPISGEQAPWDASPSVSQITNKATKLGRSGLGLGLGLQLSDIQFRAQSPPSVDGEPGSQFDDGDGDDEVSVYDDGSYEVIINPDSPSLHTTKTDKEDRKRRRETLLAIVDGIQSQFCSGKDVRESSEYSGFEGWAICSDESGSIQGKARKQRKPLRTNNDDVSLYSDDERRISNMHIPDDSRAIQGRNYHQLENTGPGIKWEATWRPDRMKMEGGEGPIYSLHTSDPLDQMLKELQNLPSHSPSQQHHSVSWTTEPPRDSDSGSDSPQAGHHSLTPVSSEKAAVIVPGLPTPFANQYNMNRRRSATTVHDSGMHSSVGSNVRMSPTVVQTRPSPQEGTARSANWPTFADDRGRSVFKHFSREDRDSFGIPSSLSYEFRATADEREVGGIPPAESDMSLLGRGQQWTQEAGNGEETGESLSAGAETLFRALTVENDEDSDDMPPIGGNIFIEAPSEDEVPSYGGQEVRVESLPTDVSLASSNSSDCSVYEEDISEPIRQQRHREKNRASLSHTPLPVRTWESTLPPSVYLSLVQRYGENEIQRQELIWELCESEATFVQRLRTITRLFIKPLRMQDSSFWIDGVPGSVTKLFDWLEDIMNVHVQINSALREMSDGQYPVVERAAEVMRAFVSRLEVYQPYVVRVECVLGQIAEEVRLASLGESDFGEFIALQELDEDCEGWNLEMLLSEPVSRLGKYSEMFQALWELTPKNHPDHLAAFALVHSTSVILRVLHEVKAREDEYELVKGLSTSIEGLPSSVSLARRERRLLARGPLYRIHDQHQNLSDVDFEDTDDPRKQTWHKSQSRRSTVLLSAINEWDTRRAEHGTSSAASSSSSDSTSSVQTAESSQPSWHSEFNKEEHLGSSEEEGASHYRRQSSSPPSLNRKRSLVDVFVFTDLILLANSLHKRQGRSDVDIRERWRLLDNIGVSRVLGITESHEMVQGKEEHLVVLDLLPVDIQDLEAGGISDDTKVTTVHLCLSGPASGEFDGPVTSQRDRWISAFNRCFQFTIRSLSFPSHSGQYLAHGLNVDLEADTRETVRELLDSGLPLPKSPSIQIEDLSSGKEKDGVQLEREERGWWAVRFRQVFKEIQRQDVSVLPTMSVS